MKRIISDTFEQLEELGKSTAKQAVQQPKEMMEEAASVVTGKEAGKGEKEEIRETKRNSQGVGSQPKLTQAQIAAKIEKAAQMRSKLHLQKIKEQIAEIREQRLEQIKRVQEETFQKPETREVQPQEAQLPSKRKRGFSPLGVVKRLTQKVEGRWGVSG